MKFRLWRYALPLLLLWLAFGLRLYHLDFQSIWWDEGHSIFVASHPIPQIPTLPAMDVHPPGYFGLLHLWMAVAGQSEFALRYLSVVFSLMVVALIWRFAASISGLISSPSFELSFGTKPHPLRVTSPLLASLLATLSPLYVAYAQEVRSYALITFLALASTFTLWQILSTTPNLMVGGRRSGVVIYAFLTAACLYTHYFTIFLLLFHNLAWLVWALFFHSNRISRFTLWLVSQAGLILLFTPHLFLALRQVTSYTNPNLTPPRLGEFITRTWQAYTVGLTIDPILAQWGMGAIAAVFAIILLLFLLQILKAYSNPLSSVFYPLSTILFLADWFVIPLAAYFIVLQRQPSFEPRYMILVTPALFLLLALGLANLQHTTYHASGITFHVSRFTFYALSAIPFTVFIIGLYNYYNNETYFKDDAAGVAAWLAAETTANDLVYVDVPHPFHYYVAQGHIAAPTRYLFVDIHTAADVLTHEAAGRDRLFWITWRSSDTDPRGVIPFLAQKYGQKLGQHDFRGYQGEWFSLPDTGTVFSLPSELNPVNATFGDVLHLDGAAYGGFPPLSDAISIDHPAWATFHFTLLHDTDIDYRVSVRLRGKEGRLVSQVDKDLLNDRHFRTSAWLVADPALNQAMNVYTLPLAADTPPGSYQLEVVVYNAQPPYPSEGVTGLESTDGVAAVIGNIRVIP